MVHFLSSLSPVSLALLFFFLGLLTGIPLNVTGNLLTPTFKNWWARRSERSLRKRIAELTAEYSRLAAFPEITDTEDWILSGVLSVEIVAILTFLSMFLVASIVAKLDSFFVVVLILILVLVLSVMRGQVRPMHDFWTNKSPTHRKRIADSIKKLESKLPRE
jgi:hypothetical protein